MVLLLDPLPFGDMAMTNAQERSVLPMLHLNHLYGGVPDPSPSGMIDYHYRHTLRFLQGAN